MPRFFQHRCHRSFRPCVIELDCGDNSFSNAMIELFEEREGSPVPDHRERIGVATMPGIRDDPPGRAGLILGCPYAGVIGVAPADMPMRRVAAQTVDSLRDRAG